MKVQHYFLTLCLRCDNKPERQFQQYVFHPEEESLVLWRKRSVL